MKRPASYCHSRPPASEVNTARCSFSILPPAFASFNEV